MSEITDKFKKADENNRLLSAYRPLPPETLKSLREYYRVGLTYSSNALEGNSLTESETKVVIEDGLTIEGKPLRDHYEAVGHAKAYDYIYKITEKEGLAEEDILALHRLFYQQIDAEKAGKYRDVKVYISGSRYAVSAESKIPAETQKLVKWYNENEKILHPVELAATLHQRFVFIHPFVDGNGRTGRALLHRWLCYRDVLRHATLPISSGLLHDVDSYMGALQSYHDGDVRPIVGELVNALEVALALAQSAMRQIDDIIERWQEQMGERRGSAIRMLPAVLVAQPVVSVAHVADHLQITPRAARDVIARACEYGMLTPMGNRRRGVFYQADELLDVLEQMTSRPAMRRMLAR